MVANIGPTQSPVTNTFQPGIGNNNDRVGTSEQEPKTNQIQPREAPTAATQQSEERSLSSRDESEARTNNSADQRSQDTGSRGSLVDIEA